MRRKGAPMLTDFEELSLQVMTAFQCKHRDGYFRVDARPYAALSLRLQGRGRFVINGCSFVTEAGDVLYIPANMPYEVEYSGTEMMVLHLSSCNYTAPEVIRVKSVSAVQTQFVRLLECGKRHGSPHLVKAQVYALLDTIAEEHAALADQTATNRYVQYMEEHFCEADLDIGAVCRALYVSRSTLQRAFLGRFGVTPQQYLVGLRTEYALELLAAGNMKIKEVAAACGFSDEKYFSVVFKKTYGFSPSHLTDHTVAKSSFN